MKRIALFIVVLGMLTAINCGGPSTSTPTPIEPPGTATATNQPQPVNLLLNGDLEGDMNKLVTDIWQEQPDKWKLFGLTTTDHSANWPEATANCYYYTPNIEAMPDPNHVYQGAQALMFAANWQSFTAGMAQRVAVEPGQMYELSAMVKGYSADGSRLVAMVGLDPSAGDVPNIALPNVGPIVWSEHDLASIDGPGIGSDYERISVRAMATGPYITAYVYGFVRWCPSRSEIYVDDLELMAVN